MRFFLSGALMVRVLMLNSELLHCDRCAVQANCGMLCAEGPTNFYRPCEGIIAANVYNTSMYAVATRAREQGQRQNCTGQQLLPGFPAPKFSNHRSWYKSRSDTAQ